MSMKPLAMSMTATPAMSSAAPKASRPVAFAVSCGAMTIRLITRAATRPAMTPNITIAGVPADASAIAAVDIVANPFAMSQIPAPMPAAATPMPISFAAMFSTGAPAPFAALPALPNAAPI